MDFYSIEKEGQILSIGFGKVVTTNDNLVKAAKGRLEEMDAAGELARGGLVLVNGPASLPVAMVLGHFLSHRFSAVGVYDPKEDAYVVAVSHDPDYKVGQVIPAE